MNRTDFEHLLRPWKPSVPKGYIFTNANVIDPVDGKVLPRCSVHLARGVIQSVIQDSSQDDLLAAESGSNNKATVLPTRSTHASILPPPPPPPPQTTVTIDLQGRYLCPGLIDNHVHLVSVPGGNGLSELWKMTADQSKFRQPWVCQQILRRGFTTVRDCGGATLALKEAIAEGVFPGPRVFMAGQALSQTGGHADLRSSHDSADLGCCGGGGGGAGLALGVVTDGVPACLKNTREQLRSGADFIKIMASGGVASPTDALTNVQFSAEEIRAITGVAKSYKTFATAHAYTPETVRHAVENGVKSIEHGNMIDEDTARLMAENDVFLTPTLIGMYSLFVLFFVIAMMLMSDISVFGNGQSAMGRFLATREREEE